MYINFPVYFCRQRTVLWLLLPIIGKSVTLLFTFEYFCRHFCRCPYHLFCHLALTKKRVKSGLQKDTTMPGNQAEPSELAVLAIGMRIAGFENQRLSRRTLERRFKEMYGCHPKIVRQVWLDIREKTPKGTKLDHVFWALFFLKKYPTDGEMASKLGKDPTTIRKWVWTVIFGLQELKAEKIRFPQNGFEMVFILSVDGTDCRIQEPTPFSKTWFSQKFKGAAVKYEVALDVLTGRCVWINGPFRGSKSDITIFREGLKDLIPDGKLAVADKGYRGEPDTCSCPNHLDDEDVAEIKKRIRSRMETFFSRMKSFKVLEDAFRHKPVMEKHKMCFEAVAVLVQYGIDLGFPLFDI